MSRVEYTRLREMLLRYEALRLKPYRCTAGRLSIGVGRNLDDVGISEDEAYYMRENDIKRVVKEASTLPWFNSLSVPRQDVILMMLFQLGLKGVLQFKKMIKELECGNFDLAAHEMLESDWRKQTPKRAEDMAKIMRVGTYL